MNAKNENIENNENKKQNFRLLNLDPQIDFPVMNESGYYDWVTWGVNNDFPQYLTDVYTLKSLTHKTIIEDKQKMIYGKGFEQTAENKLFLENIFSDDNLDEILKKVALDYEIYGAFCLNVIWSNSGDKISQIEYLPLEAFRIDKQNGKLGKPDYFWYSQDWRQRYKYKPLKYQGFSKKYKEQKSQILYYKDHTPGAGKFYSTPNWYTSLNLILAEAEIANFYRASIQQGFSGGFHIHFSDGYPSEDAMKETYEKLEERMGTYAAGKFILTFSDNQEHKAEFTPIQLQDNDSRYTDLIKTIREGIMIGNNVTNPELLGVTTPGRLGNSELLESLEIFQSKYINYRQDTIEKVFSKLAKINGIDEPLKIKKYQLDINKINK